MARDVDSVVPAHLDQYLQTCQGDWTLFDAHYLTHPEQMPRGYLGSEMGSAIERYAVGRLTADNVRAALFSFSPRSRTERAKAVTDTQCHRWALQVLEQCNHLHSGSRARAVPVAC